MFEEIFGSRRKWSDLIESGRKSEVVGSIKEGSMSSYYMRGNSELTCVIGSVNSHMWDRKVSPAQWAERMLSKKKRSKTFFKAKES